MRLIAPPWVPVPSTAMEGLSDNRPPGRGLVRAGYAVLLAASGNGTCPVPRVLGAELVQPRDCCE